MQDTSLSSLIMLLTVMTSLSLIDVICIKVKQNTDLVRVLSCFYSSHICQWNIEAFAGQVIKLLTIALVFKDASGLR